jgi:hypothetical protein
MSRLALPFEVADLSAFAKALRAQLLPLDKTPSHVELLNLISQSAGYRNYQHFRATSAAASRLSEPAPLVPVDHALVEKVARHFDAEGNMVRWPGRTKQQELCLWLLWSRIPAETSFTEREISDLLNDWHHFGDAALLRRSLFEYKLAQRTIDGRDYRRIEQKPPAELTALLARLAAMAKA